MVALKVKCVNLELQTIIVTYVILQPLLNHVCNVFQHAAFWLQNVVDLWLQQNLCNYNSTMSAMKFQLLKNGCRHG